jgi:hypothetical protein
LNGVVPKEFGGGIGAVIRVLLIVSKLTHAVCVIPLEKKVPPRVVGAFAFPISSNTGRLLVQIQVGGEEIQKIINI